MSFSRAKAVELKPISLRYVFSRYKMLELKPISLLYVL